MPAQPQNADHYVIQMLETEDIVQTRGDKIKARNRIWLKIDSTVVLNGKKVPLTTLGRELRYILTNPDKLKHLPEDKDSAVIFGIPNKDLSTNREKKHVTLYRQAMTTVAEEVRGLYPEAHLTEDRPWSEQPVVRMAIYFGPPQEKTAMLPPWSDEEPDLNKLDSRNLFEVKVKRSGKIFVRGKEVPLSRITKMAKAFIANPENKPSLAISPKNAIISLHNERGAEFDRYLKVYNALKAAYDELWNEKSQALYNEPYSDDMPFAKRKAIREEIPFIISEAEPTNY